MMSKISMIQGSSAAIIIVRSPCRKRRRPLAAAAAAAGMSVMHIAWILSVTHSLLSRRLLGVVLFYFVSVLPTAANGAASSSSGTAYYASNCYEVGGGNMGPLYLKCAGCQYAEAFECLDTLRTNASANVPTGCGINTLTVQPEPACCPVFSDPNSQGSVDGSTSGYPDTLLCLENAGCAGDKLHTALIAECKFNQCSDEFSCSAVFSSSRRLAPGAGVIALAFAGLRIATTGFGWVGQG